jgi:alkyl hydroperoxide reductase subunit AhpC
MKKSMRFAFGGLCIALAAAAAFLLTQPAQAPETRFATLGGEQFGTADLRGKVVLVNFWATSCTTCVAEMPMLSATQNKFASRGYDTIAVAMQYDHPNHVATFVQQRALPFKVVLDTDGAIARAFGQVRVTPTSMLIDKRGRILKTYLGEPKVEEFHALVDQALNEPS